MTQNIFQPIRFFPRIDSQYLRYLQHKKLQYQDMKALWFFIDRMDHCGVVSCNSDRTIVKSLCHELKTQDQHNCRAVIRKLEKLGIIKRCNETTFKINPYICNRLQNVAPSLFFGFPNLKQTKEYKAWRELDDEETKYFPSLKRRLHNAYYRDNNISENVEPLRELEMIASLKGEVSSLKENTQNLTRELSELKDEMRAFKLECYAKFKTNETKEWFEKHGLGLVRE